MNQNLHYGSALQSRIEVSELCLVSTAKVQNRSWINAAPWMNAAPWHRLSDQGHWTLLVDSQLLTGISTQRSSHTLQ